MTANEVADTDKNPATEEIVSNPTGKLYETRKKLTQCAEKWQQ